MKRLVKIRSTLLVAAILSGLGMGLTGCHTPESDNVSARPWTQQQRWEHGLPSTIYEGQ